jgi:hypothetical protein
MDLLAKNLWDLYLAQHFENEIYHFPQNSQYKLGKYHCCLGLWDQIMKTNGVASDMSVLLHLGWVLAGG